MLKMIFTITDGYTRDFLLDQVYGFFQPSKRGEGGSNPSVSNGPFLNFINYVL